MNIPVDTGVDEPGEGHGDENSMPAGADMAPFIGPPHPPRLLDQLRTHLRTRHYSIRTEQVYVDWVRRFIKFHGFQHPNLTVLVKSRHYVHIFKQEVSLDEGTAGV